MASPVGAQGGARCGLVPLLLASLVLGSGLPAAAAGPDQAPPTVLKLSARTRGEQLEVRVRVVDPSGPGIVLLHVRGPHDREYRTFPMNSLDGDRFRASVPFGGGSDNWLVYYVEATDRYGNGPGLSGSAEQPFYAVPEQAGNAVRPGGRWVAALFVVPAFILLILIVYQPGRRRRRERFWIRLLAPISATPADQLEQAIADLCASPQYHPERGLISVKTESARRWLERLKATQPERLKQAGDQHEQRLRARQTDCRSLAEASEEQIREELFWFHMLHSLVDVPAKEIDRGLRRLAARRHFHPEQGWRVFGAAVLRTRLEEVRSIDPKELFEVARFLENPPRPPASEPAEVAEPSASGASLVELVVVLALVAIVAGITALALQPLEAPVTTGGELTDSLLRQARARSLSRTSVHRVRPLDADSLIVESAGRCSSGAWSLEQQMSLDLPQGVTVSGTTWSVCFDARGIASDNVVMTFDHPEFASRRLEVLRGGTTRWLP